MMRDFPSRREVLSTIWSNVVLAMKRMRKTYENRRKTIPAAVSIHPVVCNGEFRSYDCPVFDVNLPLDDEGLLERKSTR